MDRQLQRFASRAKALSTLCITIQILLPRTEILRPLECSGTSFPKLWHLHLRRCCIGAKDLGAAWKAHSGCLQHLFCRSSTYFGEMKRVARTIIRAVLDLDGLRFVMLTGWMAELVGVYFDDWGLAHSNLVKMMMGLSGCALTRA